MNEWWLEWGSEWETEETCEGPNNSVRWCVCEVSVGQCGDTQLVEWRRVWRNSVEFRHGGTGRDFFPHVQLHRFGTFSDECDSKSFSFLLSSPPFTMICLSSSFNILECLWSHKVILSTGKWIRLHSPVMKACFPYSLEIHPFSHSFSMIHLFPSHLKSIKMKDVNKQ